MTTINFATVECLNEYLNNGLDVDENELDGLFTAIQSEAAAEDKTRAITAFSRVCLEY